jgi:hypothetical protein
MPIVISGAQTVSLITAPGLATEVFTLSAALNLAAGDVVFK